ncbi:MAG: prepilin-type N-terminal cleavage/methylation domain-containing protein [Syntrophobacteria bacterium]
MVSQNRERAYGFTLLELMVAVAILAIAFVAILKANVQSVDALVDTREMSTATLLAASKLAEIEAVGAATWNRFAGDFGDEYPDFSWELETSPAEVEGLMWMAVIVRRNGDRDREVSRVKELVLSP